MIDWRQAIDDHIDAIAGRLVGIRRHLHAHPEPSREEFETAQYLGDQLLAAGLPYKILLKAGESSPALRSHRKDERWRSGPTRTPFGFRTGKRWPTAPSEQA